MTILSSATLASLGGKRRGGQSGGLRCAQGRERRGGAWREAIASLGGVCLSVGNTIINVKYVTFSDPRFARGTARERMRRAKRWSERTEHKDKEKEKER